MKSKPNTDNKGKLLVTVFAIQWCQGRSCKSVHPDTRICPQIKSCTMTNFWLRDSLYRDTAPVSIYKPSATETTSRLLINLCTATLVMLKNFCAMTCKNHAIPSLHRDSFVAEVPGPCRCSRRVTQPPFIAGPLAKN